MDGIQKTNTDVVCPQCLRPIMGYSLYGSIEETPSRAVRKYMGWCCNCNAGFEVVQFSQDGIKWFIRKFRYFAAVVPEGKKVPEKDWQIINQLPEPPAAVPAEPVVPVVMTGPGGDFTHVVEIKQSDMIKQARDIAGALYQSLNVLLSLMGNNKKQE